MNTISNLSLCGIPAFFFLSLTHTLTNKAYPIVGPDNPELEECVEENFGEFLRQHQNGQPIKVTEQVAWGNSVKNAGASLLPSSTPIIRMIAHIRQQDIGAFGYRLKQQVSRCKYQDNLFRDVVGLILTTPSAVFSFIPSYTNNLLMSEIIPVCQLVGLVATLAFNHYQELKADEFANHYATDDELKGGLCWLLAERAVRQENTGKCDRFIQIAFDLIAPSQIKRMINIAQTMHERSICIRTTDENLHSIILNGEKQNLLIRPYRETYDLDSPDVVMRIARLKGILSGQNVVEV